MPSRKRQAGKARAGQRQQQQRVQWSQTIQKTIRWSKSCRHECPPPLPVGHICLRFCDKFWQESIKDPFMALSVAYGSYPQALDDDFNRMLILNIFAAYGAEVLLDPDSYVAAWRSTVPSGLAGAILMIENYDPAKSLDATFIRLLQTDSRAMKNIDAVQGCERTLTRFFRKRISCNCLDEKYASVKSSLPKTGICASCQQRKERKTLMICCGCKAQQYCSSQCQRADWPKHKDICKQYRAC